MTSHSAVNVYNYVVIIIMFVVLSIGILDLLQLHEICSDYFVSSHGTVSWQLAHISRTQ